MVGLRNFSQAQTKVAESATLVQVKKSNIKHSPLKMKFLAMLIRDTWLPDALAQLKFSPKHKAVDLAKMVKVSDAKTYFYVPYASNAHFDMPTMYNHREQWRLRR